MRAVFRIWFFCALLLPLTISLGMWQLDRAEQKRQMLSQLQAVRSASPETMPVQSSGLELFKPYRVEGSFAKQTILLDNRIRSGQVGYEVLQPFQTPAGFLVLVNRGWVKAPAYRDQLPDIEMPAGKIEIEGYFYQPDGVLPQYGSHRDAANTENVVRLQSLNWAQIKEFVKGPLLAEKEFRLKADMKDIGFEISWNEETIRPEKHSAYAFQWFALSVTLVFLSMIATWRFWPRK